MATVHFIHPRNGRIARACNDARSNEPKRAITVDYALLWVQTHRLEEILWQFGDNDDQVHGALKLLHLIIDQKPFTELP